MHIRYIAAYALVALCVVATGCRTNRRVPAVSERADGTTASSGAAGVQAGGEMDDVIYDDLAWLVGKWRCVSRKLLEAPHPPVADRRGLERVEAFNVYYPFGYGEPTLRLTRVPNRTIAAEMLVRTDEGDQLPMDPGYPVMIGIDRILIGHPSPFSVLVQYRYAFDETDGSEKLELWSDQVRLLFEKVSDEAGDISKSWIRMMPEQEYWLKLWKHEYQLLKFDRMNSDCVKRGK